MFNVGKYKILKCTNCGGGFAYPRPLPGELTSIYDEEYTQRYMASVMHEREFTRRRFAQVHSLLMKRCPGMFRASMRRILDVGCGSGQFLREFRDTGWESTGIELSPTQAAYATARLNLNVVLGDIMTADLPKASFDLITLFEVIEHAIEPKALMRKCRGLLAPGGVILVETPNFGGLGARVLGRNWSQLIPPLHLNFFTVRSLAVLASRTHLAILLARSVRPVFIQRTVSWPPPLRSAGEAIYALAPRLGLGGTVQLLATVGDG